MADQKTIEEMNLHELRDWKMAVMAELKEVMARIHELELIEAGVGTEPQPMPPPVRGGGQYKSIEPAGQPSGPNAHPEGADKPQDAPA